MLDRRKTKMTDDEFAKYQIRKIVKEGAGAVLAITFCYILFFYIKF